MICLEWGRKTRIWDTKSGETIKKLDGHTEMITCLAILQDGSLVSASYDTT